MIYYNYVYTHIYIYIYIIIITIKYIIIPPHPRLASRRPASARRRPADRADLRRASPGPVHVYNVHIYIYT